MTSSEVQGLINDVSCDFCNVPPGLAAYMVLAAFIDVANGNPAPSDTQELISEARCLICEIPTGLTPYVLLAVLMNIANEEPAPSTVQGWINEANCLLCLVPIGLVPYLQIQTLREISSGGGEFDPNSITGLVIWYKADAIVGLNDNDPVATWEDSSPTGNDATQGTAANRPLYKTSILNGKPVVRFDGTNDFLVFDSSVAAVPYTMFVVSTAVNSGADRVVGTGSPQCSFGPFGSGGTEWGFFANQAMGIYAIGGTPADWTVLSFVHTSSAVAQGWHDGITPGVFDPADFGPTSTSWSLGSTDQFGTDALNGDIAEFLLYNRALTTPEREQVQTYLMTKYAI